MSYMNPCSDGDGELWQCFKWKTPSWILQENNFYMAYGHKKLQHSLEGWVTIYCIDSPMFTVWDSFWIKTENEKIKKPENIVIRFWKGHI